MTEKEDDIVLKLLHTADWHLGRRFRSFSEAASLTLSRARLEAVDRLLHEAERQQVHAVLCAGDLFDDPQPPREWVDGLLDLLRARDFGERPVFLLPGNHDPVQPDSIWLDPRFRQALPRFVTVVDQAADYALVNDARLFAVPCTSRAGQSDPTKQIPPRAPGDERIRIGLVHGSTFDAVDAQLNFPISKDAAVGRGLDYLAIGDTHGFRYVPPERRQPPTIYPGAPEATAFDEREPGFVAVVFVTRQRRALVNQAKVGRFEWEERTVESLAELKQLAARSDLKSRVLRLHVDLSLTAPELEEAERLLEALAGSDARHGLVGVLDLDRRRVELDVSTVETWTRSLPAVLQTAAKTLRERATDPAERETAHRALFHLYRTTRKAS